MDEPFSGLDMALRIEMGTLIKNLQELLHLTIVFVTHDLNESLRLSDSIALISQGKILQIGNTNSVYYRPRSKAVSSLMGGGNWIDGTIQNGIFSCDFGKLQAMDIPDGKASLFLRPHQVVLSKKLTNSTFRISDIRRLGKEIQVVVVHKHKKLTIETFEDRLLNIGEEVSLDFPKSGLHYLLG